MFTFHTYTCISNNVFPTTEHVAHNRQEIREELTTVSYQIDTSLTLNCQRKPTCHRSFRPTCRLALSSENCTVRRRSQKK